MRAHYHPKAFLLSIRNIRSGLTTRTKIITILENNDLTGKKLSKKIDKSYSTIFHHLRLLENDKIIERKGTKPFFWKLTGIGQQSLINSQKHEIK